MSRTMWIKATVAFAIVAALGVAALTAVEAQERGRGRGGFGGPPPFGAFGGPMDELRRLDLTDAQRGQVRQIMEQHRDATQALRDKAMAARAALREAITADTVDETAIRQRAADAAAVEGDLAVAEAHLRQSILQVLTPDQQQQLRELRSKRQERIQNRQSRFRELRERLHERFNALH